MHIALFLYVNDELTEPGEALASGAPLNLRSCGLGIEMDGVEHSKGLWNMGRVALITPQLDECARRLAQGLPGIVRSGVLEGPGVPFLLFDPPSAAGQPALLSRFFIEDDWRREGWFPIAVDGRDDSEALYAWVAEHRDELLTPESARRRWMPPMIRVPAPAAELIAELRSAAATGRMLLEHEVRSAKSI